MNKPEFYICNHCGNFIGFIHNAGVALICCGEEMKELIPNTTEAATEKHIPQVTVAGDTVTVQVGSVAHPMLSEHYIQFVYLLTEKGGQRKSLQVGEEPSATFKIVDDTLLEVYEYCNIHGLWKVEI